MRDRRWSNVVPGLVLLLAIAGCGKESPTTPGPAPTPPAAPAPVKDGAGSPGGAPGEKAAASPPVPASPEPPPAPLPPPPPDPEPIRRQRDTKVELIRMDLAEGKTAREEKLAGAFKAQDLDALLDVYRKEGTNRAARAAKTKLLLDDLEAFLDQNKGFEEVLGFQETRKWISESRVAEVEQVGKWEAAVKGIQDKKVKVSAASGEWLATGVSCKPGCLVGFESSGKWTLGILAGESGPKGLPGNVYAAASISKHPHGCLLLRLGEGGEVLMAGGEGIVRVSGEGGIVSARCNDKDCGGNAGSVSLRVVLVPPVE